MTNSGVASASKPSPTVAPGIIAWDWWINIQTSSNTSIQFIDGYFVNPSTPLPFPKPPPKWHTNIPLIASSEHDSNTIVITTLSNGTFIVDRQPSLYLNLGPLQSLNYGSLNVGSKSAAYPESMYITDDRKIHSSESGFKSWFACISDKDLEPYTGIYYTNKDFQLSKLPNRNNCGFIDIVLNPFPL